MHCGRLPRPGRRPRRDGATPAAPTALARSPLTASCSARHPRDGRRQPTRTDPLSPRSRRISRRRRRRASIFLFMDGGPSQVDTFDLEPRWPDREHGKPIGMKTPPTQFSNVDTVLEVCPGAFRPRRAERNPGERSLPARRRLRRRPGDHPLDGLGLLRAHGRATTSCTRHEGFQGRPKTHGSWVSYGLGVFESQRPARLRRAPTATRSPRRCRLLQQRLPGASYQGSVFRTGEAWSPTSEPVRRSIGEARLCSAPARPWRIEPVGPQLTPSSRPSPTTKARSPDAPSARADRPPRRVEGHAHALYGLDAILWSGAAIYGRQCLDRPCRLIEPRRPFRPQVLCPSVGR